MFIAFTLTYFCIQFTRLKMRKRAVRIVSKKHNKKTQKDHTKHNQSSPVFTWWHLLFVIGLVSGSVLAYVIAREKQDKNVGLMDYDTGTDSDITATLATAEEPNSHKIYESVYHAITQIPNITDGEQVPSSICATKLPPSKEPDKNIRTQHFFKLHIPTPSTELAELISSVAVNSAGEFDTITHQNNTRMLKQLLPAVANHQLLAMILSDPEFAFIINYEPIDKSGSNLGRFRPKQKIIFLSYYVFSEKSDLLNTLRNEFASVNLAYSTDCRLGHYDFGVPRSSMFALTDRKHTISIFKLVNKQYEDFLNKAQHFYSMATNQKPKDSWYYAIEKALEGYHPTSNMLHCDKNSFDEKHVKLKALSDNFIDVYEIKKTGNKMYVLKNSNQTVDGTIHFRSYKYDVRTTVGAFQQMIDNCIVNKRKINSDPAYKDKSDTSNASEWFSFLEEDMPRKLLELVIPAYCEHATNYTQVDNYCKF